MFKLIRCGIFCFILIFMGTELLYAKEREYPNQPISILVGAAPGGTTDLGARALAEEMSTILGQSVVVINKPGAGGYLAGNALATAKPDGYTLALLQMGPSMPEIYTYFQSAPYTSKNIRPVSKIFNLVGVVMVKGDSPWNSFKDLIGYVKKNPGMKVGVHGPGSLAHLVFLAIEKAEGISFAYVPFPGDTPVATAVLGGHIPIGFVGYTSAKGHVESKSAKVFATYLPKRFDLLPNIPTLEELGYKPPCYAFFGIFIPKETPEDNLKILDLTFKKIAELPRFNSKIQTIGAQVGYEDTVTFERVLQENRAKVSEFLKELEQKPK